MPVSFSMLLSRRTDIPKRHVAYLWPWVGGIRCSCQQTRKLALTVLCAALSAIDLFWEINLSSKPREIKN